MAGGRAAPEAHGRLRAVPRLGAARDTVGAIRGEPDGQALAALEAKGGRTRERHRDRILPAAAILDTDVMTHGVQYSILTGMADRKLSRSWSASTGPTCTETTALDGGREAVQHTNMQAPAPAGTVVPMPVTRRTPVSVQIEQAIRARILGVELEPGAAISENEFAAQFRVSRTPVREAFIALAKEGLIEIFPQHGSFVARIALARVAQAQLIRLTLEATALARAPADMPRRTGPVLKRLLAEAEAARAAGDMQRFYRLDDDFHQALVEGSGLPLAVEVCRFIGNDIARIRHLRLPHPDYTAAILKEHRAIARALGRGDRDGAVRALTEHLQNTFVDIEHVRRDHPDYLSEQG